MAGHRRVAERNHKIVQARKVTLILTILIFGLSAVGCGNKASRAKLKEADEALKQGKTKQAIRITRFIQTTDPRNFLAKRMMGKIEGQLIQEIQEALGAEQYEVAVSKANMLLKDVDNKNEAVMTMRNEAKKYLHVQSGRKSLEGDNPVAALRMAKQALDIDPQFQPAIALQKEANGKVEEMIGDLMKTAEQLIAREQFEKLRDLAQDILSIAPQNREVADLLREANAQILARKKGENLSMAKRFYDQGIYEDALTRAEEVLKVDPKNMEAKKLLEDARAEIAKPKLRLTGFTKIKGMEIAHIEFEQSREKFMVQVGDVFNDFKVSAIDFDLKAVIVTYIKTGSQQSLTLQTE